MATFVITLPKLLITTHMVLLSVDKIINSSFQIITFFIKFDKAFPKLWSFEKILKKVLSKLTSWDQIWRSYIKLSFPQYEKSYFQIAQSPKLQRLESLKLQSGNLSQIFVCKILSWWMKFSSNLKYANEEILQSQKLSGLIFTNQIFLRIVLIIATIL